MKIKEIRYGFLALLVATALFLSACQPIGPQAKPTNEGKVEAQATQVTQASQESRAATPEYANKRVSYSKDKKRFVTVDGQQFTVTDAASIQSQPIDTEVDAHGTMPKFWSDSGEKIAYTKMDGEVAAGIFVYDLKTGERIKVSTQAEDVNHHTVFLLWEGDDAIIAYESPLSSPEQTIKIVKYGLDGSRKTLALFSVKKDAPLFEDASDKHVLARERISNRISLYDRHTFSKIKDLAGPAPQHVMRKARFAEGANQVVIGEFTAENGSIKKDKHFTVHLN
ncbi:hypothetical protein GTO91_13265 [Heliobacterium undosum]|uniref:Uncharacterized protein n=1 Tax=Heliomicrobium undosum TaxID=121734 RepID=A0A845L286_9FIRM|nr:hypothetical protein [Heliomicrobium undosum]MZP30682.1 hypothetical protein [Heliomicrobium undosum]